jgi:predicted transcriptional regulator
MAKVLALCSGEILSRYQILMRAKLNSIGLERYLHILLEAGFLNQLGVDSFQTSRKGTEFINHYRIVKSVLGELEIIENLAIP